MHNAHSVTFNDESGQHYALVKRMHENDSADLIVWHDTDGWVLKENVPRGSADQGYTYS